MATLLVCCSYWHTMQPAMVSLWLLLPRCALVVDLGGAATTFLRYRDVNMVGSGGGWAMRWGCNEVGVQ